MSHYLFPLLVLMGSIITSNASPTAASSETSSDSSSSTITNSHHQAFVATLATDDLVEYSRQPPEVRQLIAQGLALTHLHLYYKYGSFDPGDGGMDCSGTIYYLLHKAGLEDVPRDASEMYRWVWQKSGFQSVISTHPTTFELDRLKPGDLLFWTGTYQVHHDPPISHVMLYLGTNRTNGHRVMLGASEGRPFEGQSRYGVSVFDFQVSAARSLPDSEPAAAREPRFVGYGSIPGLEGTDSESSPKKSIPSP